MKQQSLVAEAALCLLPINDRLPSAESITTYHAPVLAAFAWLNHEWIYRLLLNRLLC